MRSSDFVRLIGQSVAAHRMRSVLTALGIGIGVTAVVLLTSIGEGLNRYMVEQFTQFGTTTLAGTARQVEHVRHLAGRAELGAAAEPRRRRGAEARAACAAAPCRWSPAARRSRRAAASAASPSTPWAPNSTEAFKFDVVAGTFLPPDELERARNVAVLGAKLYAELYGGANALGDRIRVGGQRYRVIGVMESKGDMVGIDLDDTVYIPAARGLELFNRQGLLEIDVLYAEDAPVDEVVDGIERILAARHGGEDFTIVTQQQMLDVLGSIVDVLTLGVAALGGISLLVGGVGHLHDHDDRRARADAGDRPAARDRRAPFAASRSCSSAKRCCCPPIGGVGGLALGIGIVLFTQWALPSMPATISPLYVVLSLAIWP